MAANRSETYVQRLQNYCASNAIEQPQWQDYSDPRGIRTAWSSAVFVQGREYRAQLWRDYRYLDQSREEAAEVAYRALVGAPTTTVQPAASYTYSRSGYGSSR
ncbi:hypothetical protein K504DRAFT_470403 [Pleomassaria siparia CBS 279.74]|uniref:DRBM domain-containing protein n=1 Tax=Pleomassaria siparia CBS 279.74 TaxID=1314801 RepID=A0A6G1K2U4_9PLEO|nr:hypothetical protein K504DRAFT_470403 [Pleomassaria siparia CBS 279.74]